MFSQERHYWEWFLLLLCLASSLGQDDDPATPDPTAAADPDTKSADDTADDTADPEWEYVQFLQKNIRFDKC